MEQPVSQAVVGRVFVQQLPALASFMPEAAAGAADRSCPAVLVLPEAVRAQLEVAVLERPHQQILVVVVAVVQKVAEQAQQAVPAS